jgi:preprotein translocase subunit SecG
VRHDLGVAHQWIEQGRVYGGQRQEHKAFGIEDHAEPGVLDAAPYGASGLSLLYAALPRAQAQFRPVPVSMLQDILLVILILDGIALTGIILLQKSEGGGLVSGGGGGQFMTARGTANLLTRTTEILTAIFFVTALTITIVIGRTASPSAGSVVDKVNVQALSPAALAAQQKQQAAAIAAQQRQAQGLPPAAPEAPAPTLGAPLPSAPAPAPLNASPFGAPPAPGR